MIVSLQTLGGLRELLSVEVVRSPGMHRSSFESPLAPQPQAEASDPAEGRREEGPEPGSPVLGLLFLVEALTGAGAAPPRTAIGPGG